MPSIVPNPRKGVVANGRANTCFGPFVRAVPGAPQRRSVCVSIPQPPSGEFPKFPFGIIPGFPATLDTAHALPQPEGDVC